MIEKYKTLLVFGFILAILFLTIRGISGSPDEAYFASTYWQGNGPLELSPEKGRFVLLYSLVERGTDKLNANLANFAVPDVGYFNDGFVSLFAPGVSLISIPGYIVGRYFGISQVGTYASITLFAFMNTILIYKIAEKLGANQTACLIASIVFIFATPSFPYAVSFYQHHISVFLILFSVYLLFKDVKWYRAALVWVLYGTAIIIDNPNAFLMLPIIIFLIVKIFDLKILKRSITVKFNIYTLLSAVFFIIPLILYGYYNYKAYGNPFILSGAVQSVDYIDHEGSPGFFEEDEHSDRDSENLFSLFYTRNLVNGLYIHLFSPDRGIIYYAPIMLIALISITRLKKLDTPIILLLSIAMVNITIYSLWGDPWGGWAFGSRYLIPSYAIFSIILSVIISQTGSKLYVFLVCLFGVYSIGVNTLGALTTNKLPPKIQVLELERISNKEQKYTYVRNFQYLRNEGVKSYIYNQYLSDYISAVNFYYSLSLLIMFMFSLLIFYQYTPTPVSTNNSFNFFRNLQKFKTLPLLNRLI